MANITSNPYGALSNAVLFVVFNRLDTTQKVFQEIRKAKPPRLYVAADGPRKNRPGEEIKVKQVRDYVMKNIDWECEVKTLFREDNLGCKFGPHTAIDWFFENEEMGIILEDDCLPSQSFFWYCEELLELYRTDSRIMLISGYNKLQEWKSGNSSYFFSNFGGIWGWASWRRAWSYNDIDMPDIEDFIEQHHFVNQLGKKLGRKRQNSIYKNIKIKKQDAWDYQWAYARHKNRGLACVPILSLIENIGFGSDATHTTGNNLNNVKRHDIKFPLRENNFIVPDMKYDIKYLSDESLWKKFLIKFRSLYV